jgi:hypothetical protein
VTEFASSDEKERATRTATLNGRSTREAVVSNDVLLAIPAGFEPATLRVEIRYSSEADIAAGNSCEGSTVLDDLDQDRYRYPVSALWPSSSSLADSCMRRASSSSLMLS